MKQLIVCLGLLLACAIPCAAQKASGPFADVAPNTWPFAAQDTIKAAGIAFGYPDGTYGGRLAVTRYEVAVATAHLLTGLREMPTPPKLSGDVSSRAEWAPRLKQNPLALNALIALVNEFSLELSRLGQDVPKATARLKGWQGQQRQDIRDGKIMLTPEQWKSPFADIPREASAWRLTDAFAQAGLVGVGMPPMSNWPGSTFGWLPLTRLQMAQSLLRLVSNKEASGDISMRLQKSPKAITALNSLSSEFTPELKLLGTDMSVYEVNLADLAHHQPLPLTDYNFTDVPPGHWAWQAVETLRQHGLLAGYPNRAYTLPEGKR